MTNKIFSSQNNFSSGKLSPEILGRIGLQMYRNGVQDLTIFLILPSGGITRRPESKVSS